MKTIKFQKEKIRQLFLATLFVPLAWNVYGFQQTLEKDAFVVDTNITQVSNAPLVRLPKIETVQAKAQAKLVAPKPVAAKPQVRLHALATYGLNPSTIVENTSIYSVYLVPADQVEGTMPDWKQNMEVTMKAMADYLHAEFNKRMTVSYTVHPQPIMGQHNVAEYGEFNPAFHSMREEVMATIGWNDIVVAQQKQGRHPVLMIYFQTGYQERFQAPDAILGGAYSLLHTAFLPAFQLEDEMITGQFQQGLISSTHEFAHLLGIPHPWEMEPAVEDSADNLMGYMAKGLLKNAHIHSRVKQLMGL